MNNKFGSFSDAIRAGAKLRPQCACLIFAAGRSCAVGAGLEALGVAYQEDLSTRDSLAVYRIAESAYPYLDARAYCPVSECRRTDTLLNQVWHLNDHHRYSRERIADWLQSEEDKLGYVTLTEEVRAEVPDQDLVTVGLN